MTDYTLTLNDQDLNILAAGIKELPWKVAQPLMEKLHGQLLPQQAQQPPPPAPEMKDAAQMEQLDANAKLNGQAPAPTH